ncbi:glycosyltransferase family 25 protein [Acinetobacter guerrae]|uniref:Glycosyltransferase family 25 protein n=1 Tax=Acinetobacter guerrae TaxID=1843371 RepID=A0A3A8EI61_9GAMM|nr:glycosyltransferase family 25 protein [Acinetobacter guerrae]RKG33859.1 glycosyltransferase family 25 protein [Acinetobacter guerrae]
MQIYIISIEKDDSERLQKFLKQFFFKNLDQSYKKIGIKGADLSAKQYFEQAVKGREIALTPGELGCTLSHLQAIELFLKTEDEYAFIIEDDAILPNNLTLELLKKEIKKFDLSSKTLFSLGGIQMKESRKVRGHFRAELFLQKKVLEVVPDYYHRVNYTMAYIVDREMARTLLAYHHLTLRRADDWSYLFDFDNQVHLLMTHIVDHPVIEKGEINEYLSVIEAERTDRLSLKKSQYGSSIKRSFIKLYTHTYFN